MGLPFRICVMKKKPGRNAPCPCGSGKKYKMCCLKQEEEIEKPLVPPLGKPTLFEGDIDKDSNRVVDLIHEGRLEEAEEAAKDLLEKYPDLGDGLERTAAVLEAKGERERAAESYRKAAKKYLEIDPEYGHEMAGFCNEKARELEGDAPLEG
jgi:tetratricopeptide (TPR) repeat protein